LTLIVLVWLLAGCTPPDVVRVRADEGWQDTGFEVRGGRSFSVEYLSGRWTAWPGTVPLHDADGTAYICGDAERCCEPIADFRKEALIGKVGDELFPIGNGGTFTPRSSGVLYLRMNDCDGALTENRGSVKVRIEP
jgi:hypothetical protein